MATTPTTTNTTATAVDAGIQTTGDALVTLAENLCIAAVPALAWPFFKQIWEAVFGWIAGKFIKAGMQLGTFTVIDLQVSSEKSNMATAEANLEAAEKSGDPHAIAIAQAAYDAAQKALVSDDGSTSATQ